MLERQRIPRQQITDPYASEATAKTPALCHYFGEPHLKPKKAKIIQARHIGHVGQAFGPTLVLLQAKRGKHEEKKPLLVIWQSHLGDT